MDLRWPVDLTVHEVGTSDAPVACGAVMRGRVGSHIYGESPFAHPHVMIRHAIVERLGGYRAGITRMRSFECVSVIRCNMAEPSSAVVAPSA